MFRIETFGERNICVKGIGKMFYQEGYPIGMLINEINKKGIEVSVLHIADECLKHGWSAETTIRKLTEELNDSGLDSNVAEFCNSTYEAQREMIFKYLFSNRDIALEWAKNKYHD